MSLFKKKCESCRSADADWYCQGMWLCYSCKRMLGTNTQD